MLANERIIPLYNRSSWRPQRERMYSCQRSSVWVVSTPVYDLNERNVGSLPVQYDAQCVKNGAPALSLDAVVCPLTTMTIIITTPDSR